MFELFSDTEKADSHTVGCCVCHFGNVLQRIGIPVSTREDESVSIIQRSKKCSDLSDALSEQRRAKELAEKKFRHNNICITCILVLFALASILLTVKLFQFGNAQGKDYLTVLSVILNIVLFAVPISFQIVVGKPLDAHNFISKWLQKMLSKKYKKYGYDKDEEERLQNEYNEVMGTLDELKERISERIPIGV